MIEELKGNTITESGKIIPVCQCSICGWRYHGLVEKCENKVCGKTEKLVWIKAGKE